MLVLRAARLFDGHNAHLIKDATVLVTDGRITAVRSGAITLDGAGVVDLGDVTLLPGLIDAHLHLAFDASTDPVAGLTTASDTELLARMRQEARSALLPEPPKGETAKLDDGWRSGVVHGHRFGSAGPERLDASPVEPLLASRSPYLSAMGAPSGRPPDPA
jgi:imidazolonepropionase-like amidohydrolase